MLTDIDKEFDTPIIDENGELIEVIEIEEIFGDVNNQEPIEEDSYDGEDDIVDEEHVENAEEIIVESKESYENTKDQLISIFSNILEKGEITAEDNVNIELLKEQYSEAYNVIKETSDNKEKKTLEERIQELADGMVGASVDDILNILTEGGTKTWLYKDDDGNVLIDMTAIPLVTAVFNKLFLIATDGEDESSIQLTPEMINLISTTITLTAEHINLNGYISNDGGNFALDQQGNLEVNDLNVKGEFSCESLILNNIDNPKYPPVLEGSLTLYIDPEEGSDDASLEDGKVFASIMGVISRLPKNLGGKTVNIVCNKNTTENISIDFFICGRIRTYLNGKTLYGYFRTASCFSSVQLFGGTPTDSEGQIGNVMPNTGYNHSGISASISIAGSVNCYMSSLDVYAPVNNPSGTTESSALCCGENGYVYTSNITPINCVYGFRTNARGVIYDNASLGLASRMGFVAVSGGEIKLSNGVHTGGTVNNTYESSGGTVKAHTATFTNTEASGTNTSTAPKTTQTDTYTSTYGDTYRSTWSSWKKDGVVRQSEGYGSGKCYGCWFFGSQFNDLKGADISKIVLKIKRNQAGAWSSYTPHKLAYHNYTGRPSGQPTLTYFQTENIKYTGDYVSITITNSTVLAGIKAGTIKGFGLYDSTFTEANYTACSGTAKATLTYTED